MRRGGGGVDPVQRVAADHGVAGDIHAGMHQIVVVVEQQAAPQRLAEIAAGQHAAHRLGIERHRVDVGIDDEDALACGVLDRHIVGGAEAGIVAEHDHGDHEVVELGHQPRQPEDLLGILRRIADIDPLADVDAGRLEQHRLQLDRLGRAEQHGDERACHRARPEALDVRRGGRAGDMAAEQLDQRIAGHAGEEPLQHHLLAGMRLAGRDDLQAACSSAACRRRSPG